MGPGSAAGRQSSRMIPGRDDPPVGLFRVIQEESCTREGAHRCGPEDPAWESLTVLPGTRLPTPHPGAVLNLPSLHTLSTPHLSWGSPLGP